MTSSVFQPIRSNTILYCRKWHATVAFYRQILGLSAAFENEWFVEFHLHDGAFLSIADASRSSIDAVAGQGITLAWQVEQLREMHTYLASAGLEVTDIRRRWNAWVFYCYDPEGHRLEFWSVAVSAGGA